MTKIDAAKKVMTVEFPNGISERTITNRRDKNPDFYTRYTLLIATAFREANPIAAISKEKALAEMEGLLGAAFSTVRVALANNDIQAALRVIDQFVPKPGQKLEISGGFNVDHRMIWQPERKLIQQERDMDASDSLLSALPEHVIEAELVVQ